MNKSFVPRVPVTKSLKKIALLVESSREYGRGILLGIAKYTQTTRGWLTTHHPERSLEEGIPAWFKDTNFDGVIFRSDNAMALEEIARLNIPVIDLCARHQSTVPVIETDDQEVVRLAADHLLGLGHRHIGFCGFEGLVYSDRRLRLLQSYLADKNCVFSAYETPAEAAVERSTQRIESSAVNIEPKMARWLYDLPKPAGIVACNDIRGSQVIQACLQLGITIPDNVSVIGVDNDPVICNLASPSLSSVANNTELIGFRAAEYLDNLIDHGKTPPKLTLIPPQKVVSRLSTDSTMIADEIVAKAIAYIRDNACRGIEVTDVVQQLPMSRATVERRFKKATARTINEEIKRIRIAQVKKLLIETELKLPEIAKLAGFNHPEYLSSLFKKEVGQTPGKYRVENRWQW